MLGNGSYLTSGNIAIVVFVYFVIKETKGVPLEEMDRLFGGVSAIDVEQAKGRLADSRAAEKLDEDDAAGSHHVEKGSSE